MSTPQSLSLPLLVELAREIAQKGERTLLGVTGAPGAGKSTVTAAIVEALGPERAVIAPMDGFHMLNSKLHELNRRDRKGAPDTFEVSDFVDLLQRLKNQHEEIILAPDFDRTIDAPVADAIAIHKSVPLVITEGNYLLRNQGGWEAVAPLLSQSWFVLLDDEVRQERLIKRHISFGMTREEAAAWTLGSDEANAMRIREDVMRADLVITLTE
jgi:pantothenate kinase